MEYLIVEFVIYILFFIVFLQRWHLQELRCYHLFRGKIELKCEF